MAIPGVCVAPGATPGAVMQAFNEASSAMDSDSDDGSDQDDDDKVVLNAEDGWYIEVQTVGRLPNGAPISAKAWGAMKTGKQVRALYASLAPWRTVNDGTYSYARWAPPPAPPWPAGPHHLTLTLTRTVRHHCATQDVLR